MLKLYLIGSLLALIYLLYTEWKAGDLHLLDFEDISMAIIFSWLFLIFESPIANWRPFKKNGKKDN